MFVSKKKFNGLTVKINEIEKKLEHLIFINENAEPYGAYFSEQKRTEAVYALNLCTVSVSQIIDYNDIYILEQEREMILSNINLQKFFKDESFLKVFTKILSIVSDLKLNDADRIYIENEYRREMQNAFWEAVPNLNLIFAGGNAVFKAVASAVQIGIGYVSYIKNKDRHLQYGEKRNMELDRETAALLDGLRRELFEAAWRVSAKHNFDDECRLTEKQIRHYNKILTDPDPLRRFENLETITDSFKIFPPFWYHLGSAAREIFSCGSGIYSQLKDMYKAKALEAFRKFETVYIKFLRDDSQAAFCRLEHISLLDIVRDRDEIVMLLKKISADSGSNPDIWQICLMVHMSLGQQDETKNILKRLINAGRNLEFNGLLLSRIYYVEKNESDYKLLANRIGESNVMPWIEDEAEANDEYIKKKNSVVTSRFKFFLGACIGSELKKIAACFGCEREHGIYSPHKNSYDMIVCFVKNNFEKDIASALNSLFCEVGNMPVFGSEKQREATLRKITSDFSEGFENLRTAAAEVKSLFTSSSGTKIKLHANRKEHHDNLTARKKIEEILLLTERFFSDLGEALSKRFSECINSTQAAANAESIIRALDAWHSARGVPVPEFENIHDLHI
ncbi:MAG: hypothetical protein FWE82_01245 [Defluviitaleaceae bacterium]|nr:hypothetical protein [Defluviitaleaceae bacterium]